MIINKPKPDNPHYFAEVGGAKEYLINIVSAQLDNKNKTQILLKT